MLLHVCTHLSTEDSVYDADDAVQVDISAQSLRELFVLPENGRYGP